MPGLRPQEGDVLSGQILLKSANILTYQSNTDRSSNLKLCLYTAPTSLTNTVTFASFTKVSGSGYADASLVDGSWTNVNEVFSYAATTFTPVGGNWTGIYGYFIHTNSAGSGTSRVLACEQDPNAPITVNNGSDYIITPQITFS